MAVVRYRSALRDALFEEMTRDKRVVLLGQDIGNLGGSFAVTKGLLEAFGPERVIETPISESAIIGAAVGMAMMGMRPVAELMFADFLTLGMDHLVNGAAKAVFSSGGTQPLPLVVRAPYGATGLGMHHDQSPEAWVANVPGLKIAVPATSADAKGMLKASIRDPNPVLFLEHKALYKSSGPVGDENDLVTLGKAAVLREGQDISVITFGGMVPVAMKTAATLSKEGIEVEVVDLRSLRPLDMDTVLSSAHRTRRAIILHEAPVLYGVGGEIAAGISENLFGHLLAPPVRVGAPDMPIPGHDIHRKFYVPDESLLTSAIRRVLSRPLPEKNTGES